MKFRPRRSSRTPLATANETDRLQKQPSPLLETTRCTWQESRIPGGYCDKVAPCLPHLARTTTTCTRHTGNARVNTCDAQPDTRRPSSSTLAVAHNSCTAAHRLLKNINESVMVVVAPSRATPVRAVWEQFETRGRVRGRMVDAERFILSWLAKHPDPRHPRSTALVLSSSPQVSTIFPMASFARHFRISVPPRTQQVERGCAQLHVSKKHPMVAPESRELHRSLPEKS